MLKKQLLLSLSVLTFVFTLLPFIMGAKVLTYPLIKDPYFPFGNLLAAFGFVSLPCIFYFGSAAIYYPVLKTERVFSKLFKAFVFLNALWIPVGYFLSGNLSNSFGNATGFQGSELAMELFWMFNYSLLVLPFALWILYLTTKLFSTKTNPKKELMHPNEASYILKGISYGFLTFKIAPGYYWDGPKTVSFEFICKGYIINIFVDVGELDYVDRIIAPDGRQGGYDNWFIRENYIEPIEQLSDKELDNLIAKFEQKQSA